VRKGRRNLSKKKSSGPLGGEGKNGIPTCVGEGKEERISWEEWSLKHGFGGGKGDPSDSLEKSQITLKEGMCHWRVGEVSSRGGGEKPVQVVRMQGGRKERIFSKGKRTGKEVK